MAVTFRRILIVDSGGGTHRALHRLLDAPAPGAAEDLEVAVATGPSPAIAQVRQAARRGQPFAVAFIQLADSPGGPSDAAETIRALWGEDPGLQVVACTSGPEESARALVEGLDHGDRLLLMRSPFDAAVVRQLTATLGEKRRRAVHAKTRLAELESSITRRTLELEHANEHLRREVAERKTAEKRLRHHAFHDALTGLANRALLTDRLEECVAHAQRHPEDRFAVLFLDIDNFKLINDSLGHDAGDELLVATTRRLRTCLRSLDSVTRASRNLAARLGGDEFVILLDGVGRPRDAAVVCERIGQALAPPFDLRGSEVGITVSIGVALSSTSALDAGALLRDADTALYRAKGAGKAQFALFDRAMHAEAMSRLRLESDLRRAIDEDELTIVYQPIIALDGGRVTSFEALVRWDHSQRGQIAPEEFLPVAEETGLIVPLGTRLLEQACRQLAAWDAESPDGELTSIAVNLSRRQLLGPDLLGLVERSLESADLEPWRLDLEITERAIIEDLDAAARRLADLKAIGVGLHMDDFGTGYSSLTCLHRLPLDVVKIDQSFLATLGLDRNYAAVVHGIITVAHKLGMRVTAEGVETDDQLSHMLALNCDFAQGYLFSEPLDAAAAAALRHERRWRPSA